MAASANTASVTNFNSDDEYEDCSPALDNMTDSNQQAAFNNMTDRKQQTALDNMTDVNKQIMDLLELDENDSELSLEVVKTLLENGLQSLASYKDDLIGDAYENSMRDHSDLLKVLKKYHRDVWNTKYCTKYSWFHSFVEKMETEAEEVVDIVLTRIAKHGNRFLKNCAILSIVIQLLFESLCDDDMPTTFENIWNSSTYEGLQSINQYADFILPEVMNKQLDRNEGQRLNSPLFWALREYHNEELFQILKESGVANRNNLYEIVLDCVAEYGWIKGIEVNKTKTAPRNFETLKRKIEAIVARKPVPEPVPTHVPELILTSVPEPIRTPVPIPGLDPIFERLSYLENLYEDLCSMPSCAERTTMELLYHYGHKYLGKSTSSSKTTNDTTVKKLQEQVKKQELSSSSVSTFLQSLELAINSSNDKKVVETLEDLLKVLQPLDIQELRRLIEKTKEAADPIRDKDVILLIGETGAGKSTTIQFLAGCEMQKQPLEIEPGRYLDHIAAVKVPNYLYLKDVLSNPRCQSVTRYITPITIPLKDIFGSGKTGDIVLCDTPGIGDTAGPEIDIANAVGVVEAVKGCRSVKLLVLSSFKGLGDRAQGIQRLAHNLNKFIVKAKDRLDAVQYAFTKYPPTTDVYAHILDIKEKQVDENHSLNRDEVFVALFEDLIQKTKDQAQLIDPIHGNRQSIIKILQKMNGIEYPEEAFRFSMSLDTQKTILGETKRYEQNIRCAVKHKDVALVKYYFDMMKLLQDLTKEECARSAYGKSVRFIIENIDEYCSAVKERFNRALESIDGLREEDIQGYKASVEYVQAIENALSSHLDSDLVLSSALLQNIHSELQKQREVLKKHELCSPLVGTHLKNLHKLKSVFRELEPEHNKSCQDFEARFDTLAESVRQPISNNDFSQTAEIMLMTYKSSCNLKTHLGEKLEEKYRDIFCFLVKHLNSINDDAESILRKIHLNDNDVNTLRAHLMILRSAKDTPTLQDRFLIFAELLKTKSDDFAADFKSLNEIYNEFIGKIVKHFDRINEKIQDLFKNNRDSALESIEQLMNDMDTIRKIPFVEARTSETYHRTVENVRGYMQQLKKDAEQLLADMNKNSGSINYSKVAKSLSQLKNAEWINRVSPGTHESLMKRIKEDLLETAQKLEDQLKRLDFHIRHPENVIVAQGFVEKIESMKRLEYSVPELESYRHRIIDWFRKITQEVFDNIQNTFNLQNKDVYTLKLQLKELEERRNKYSNLHPSQKYLRDVINKRKCSDNNRKSVREGQRTLCETCRDDRKSNIIDTNIWPRN